MLVFMQEVSGRALALDLQDQIEGTLDELATRCILELLAFPLDKEYEPQRQQGLQGLRTLLWTLDANGNGLPLGGLTREQLMKEAFSLMTAAEQARSLTAFAYFMFRKINERIIVAHSHIACWDCDRGGRN